MTPLSKIRENELKCSDAVDGMEDNDNEEGGTLFNPFTVLPNFIQDDILSAANAFTAKGAEEYLDESLHQSPLAPMCMVLLLMNRVVVMLKTMKRRSWRSLFFSNKRRVLLKKKKSMESNLSFD